MRWVCFGFDLLLPFLMLLFGWWMYKRAPKDINGAFGYRTRRSMKNEETWKFAHTYCGRVWLITGAILLVVSAAAALLPRFASAQAAQSLCGKMTMAQCAVMVLTIPITENALKKQFPDDKD